MTATNKEKLHKILTANTYYVMESETAFLPFILYQVNGVVLGEVGDCGCFEQRFEYRTFPFFTACRHCLQLIKDLLLW